MRSGEMVHAKIQKKRLAASFLNTAAGIMGFLSARRSTAADQQIIIMVIHI